MIARFSKIHPFRSCDTRFLDWLLFPPLPSSAISGAEIGERLNISKLWEGRKRQRLLDSVPILRPVAATLGASMHRRHSLARRATEPNPLPLLRAAPQVNFARAPRFACSLPSFRPFFLPSDTHSAPAIACPRATKTNQYPLPSTARGQLFRLLPLPSRPFSLGRDYSFFFFFFSSSPSGHFHLSSSSSPLSPFSFFFFFARSFV